MPGSSAAARRRAARVSCRTSASSHLSRWSARSTSSAGRPVDVEPDRGGQGQQPVPARAPSSGSGSATSVGRASPGAPSSSLQRLLDHPARHAPCWPGRSGSSARAQSVSSVGLVEQVQSGWVNCCSPVPAARPCRRTGPRRRRLERACWWLKNTSFIEPLAVADDDLGDACRAGCASAGWSTLAHLGRAPSPGRRPARRSSSVMLAAAGVAARVVPQQVADGVQVQLARPSPWPSSVAEHPGQRGLQGHARVTPPRPAAGGPLARRRSG